MLKQICISFAFPMFALAQAPYASERPMTKRTIFGKGIIPGGDFDSHPAFTPDARTIYFVRSAPNFNFWTIFVSRFENGHWTPPEVAPFSGQYSMSSVYYSGRKTVLFPLEAPGERASKERQRHLGYE